MRTASDNQSQQSEVPKDCISPNADVFSYFMLATPNERLKHHGRFTLDAGMSYVLVLVTLVMQGILLFCVYEKVTLKNARWRDGIVNTGKDWNLITTKTGGCNDGKSLCQMENGTYTCAPPSVQLIGRWSELDLNGDGVWTQAEVMKAREDLKCKYAVDPLEIFHDLISLLKERKKHIWLHPDVLNSTALRKNYFTYIMGDIAMCGYRNADMCGNLLKRGIFDVPLKTGKVPRVGSTITDALDYCQDLLAPRGLCERVLPSTYSTWKIESVEECDKPEYSQFMKEDPSDGSFKSLLEVDYNAREDYEMAQTSIFMAYKSCIIFFWLLLIVSQLREVGKVVAWVIQLPAQIDEAQRAIDEEAAFTEHGTQIHCISFQHRVFIFLVTFARITMISVLAYVGLNFLGRQTDYVDLLLDGVALIFIVQIAQFLYKEVLRQDVRTSWEEHDPIQIIKVGFASLTSRPDVQDLLWFLLVLLMAMLFMWYHTGTVVKPLYNALQCTCLSEGQSCREAHTFSKSFWDQYWSTAVPSSIDSIEQLRVQFETASVSFQQEAKANLQKYRHHVQAHLG